MLGVVGSLSLDLVEGAPARPGGAVLYAAQALELLGAPARILAKCAPPDRVELGVATEWLPAATTTVFAFSYDGDRRTMSVVEVGDPWRPEDVEERMDGVEWLHVGGLLRSDFPPETIADTASPASPVCSKKATSVRTVSGFGITRSQIFVATPSVPSEPTKAPSRS